MDVPEGECCICLRTHLFCLNMLMPHYTCLKLFGPRHSDCHLTSLTTACFPTCICSLFIHLSDLSIHPPPPRQVSSPCSCPRSHEASPQINSSPSQSVALWGECLESSTQTSPSSSEIIVSKLLLMFEFPPSDNLCFKSGARKLFLLRAR